MARMLVCGAGGMLGMDVVRAARSAGWEVVGLGRAELDVRSREAVMATVAGERPDVVVNCAAYTDVDAAEDDLEGAMEVNASGAGHVAEAAAAREATVIQLSTDYVFDGRKAAPYVESDPPRPQSVYGQTKHAGEREVAARNPRHHVVRSAWLFGTAGRNFVETMLRLAREHGEARVVDDQVGCPTYTGHLAAALVELAAGEAWGLRHLAGAGETSWHGFAAEIFRRAGVDCRLSAVGTEEFPRPAPRPPYSVLGTERTDGPRLAPWQEGLRDYLVERRSAAR